MLYVETNANNALSELSILYASTCNSDKTHSCFIKKRFPKRQLKLFSSKFAFIPFSCDKTLNKNSYIITSAAIDMDFIIVKKTEGNVWSPPQKRLKQPKKQMSQSEPFKIKMRL